jgi:hypothetical protein
MSFSFDSGPQGSDGPWLAWSARGTQDGTVPAKSFMLRDKGGKRAFDGFERGVVLDIHTMKTGWQRSEGMVGVAPDWKWNASPAQMQPQPGEDYKRGFSIRCAISKTETATWEQAGASVWGAFTALVPALQQGPAGKLPVVRMTGSKFQQFARGSTVEPVLEVVKWVDRPEALTEGAAPQIDTGAGKPAPAPAAATADELEF